MPSLEHEPPSSDAASVDTDPATKKSALVTLAFSVGAALVLTAATASLFLTESCTPSSSSPDPTATPTKPATPGQPTTPTSGSPKPPTPPPTNNLPPPPT